MSPVPLPFVSTSLLVAAVIVGAGLLARRYAKRGPVQLTAWLESPWAPWGAAAISAALVWIAWGSLYAPPVVHDERAYLLQAEIFASGRWTAPSPPLPVFFEQPHVFVEPAVFAKYPPLHALLLVPGVWLGLPGLMPVLLSGLAGALVFWLVRRVADPWIALLTWLLWITNPGELFWRASYFSQVTSSALWLMSLWALLHWMDTRRTHFLALVSAAIALGLQTRPFSFAVLALPIAFVVLRQLWHLRVRVGPSAETTPPDAVPGMATGAMGRQLTLATVVGLLLLAGGPLWNYKTLGDWRIYPYEHYSAVYFPFDKPGFGIQGGTQSTRPLTRELHFLGRYAYDLHLRHVPAQLPTIASDRVKGLFRWLSDRWRIGLLIFFLWGLVRASKAEWFGLCSLAALMAGYLTMATGSWWTIYYVEAFPVVAFIAAGGIVRLLQRLDGGGPIVGPRTMTAVASIAAVSVPLLVTDVGRVREAVRRESTFDRRMDATLASIPDDRAIVFVPFWPRMNYHRNITRNTPDPGEARVWVVYDLGPQNARLTALAPERAVYSLDLSTMRVTKQQKALLQTSAARP